MSWILKHAYFNNPGGPEIEVFLELGLELLLVLGINTESYNHAYTEY